MGRAEDLAAGAGGHQVPQGQEGQGQGRLRLPRPAEALGRVRLLLPRQPRDRLRQVSRTTRPGCSTRHHEAARQQSGLGARHPGRHRRAALRARRPDQRRSEHDRLPAVPRRHRLDARMVGRHRLERQDQRHLGRSATSSASTSCPARTTSTTSKTGKWEKLASGPNFAPNMAYLGWGIYVMARGRQRSEEAEGGLERRGASRRQGPVAVDGGLSVGLPALPQQPLQHRRVGGGRLRRGVHHVLPRSRSRDSYNHPNARDRAAHPRHLPVLQRRRGRAGQDLRRQDDARRQGADNIAAAWEKLTDKLGRDNQIKLYKASLGIVGFGT